VIASSPNDVALCSYPSCSEAAWTLNGTPVPYTTEFDNLQPSDNPDAVIPVQKIHGAIFLDCGKHDEVWTSCAFANAIMSGLAAHHDPYQHVLYAYSHASHALDTLIPYEPDKYAAADRGSSSQANQIAQAELWPRLVSFLHNSATRS
jgi:hypothetical protein